MNPLGNGNPEWVKWSISMVRTPLGWVGRYDTYGAKGGCTHLPVEPSFALSAHAALLELEKENQKKAKPEFDDFDDNYDDGVELEEDEDPLDNYDDIVDEKPATRWFWNARRD